MNNEQLLQYIQEIVTSIVEEISNSEDLTAEENQEELLSQIAFYLDEFDLTIEDVLPQMVIQNYFGGVDEATKQLDNAGVDVENALSLTSSGQVAQGFQRRIHMEAVEEILDDTLLDFRAAIRTTKRNASASINSALEAVKGDITRGIITGDTNRVVSKRVMDSFARNGLTSFTTVDGKNLPLDFYANTVVRTKTREASTKGHANRYEENDVGLVQINERADTCSVCAKYDGMVVSLTGEHEGFPTEDEIPLPPYHPNCRGTVRPYVIEFKSSDEVEREKNKWNNFNPEEDSRTASQKRAYEREQKARRQANEEKKQFMRWNGALGAENYKTLGAFRRAKRSNSTRFQELQSEYMSIAQQAKSQ